jgi:diguanylate cyclase (GGDEF)-like protein/PAS domain S-box-containing protein
MLPHPIKSWWSQLSLISRLLSTMVTASFLIGTLLLYTTVQSASNNYRHELDEQLKDELSAFAPLLIKQAVIGDYASIQQMLELWVQRKGLMLAAWTDLNGKRIEAKDMPIVPESPAWFSYCLNIPEIGAEESLALGGQSYGKLTMMLTSAPKMNLVWHTFLSQFSIMLAGFLLILSMTALLLRRGLRPLHNLAASAERFGKGDYSVRLAPIAIPDILPSISAFNNMAQEIEMMLAQAQQHNTELQDSESRWRFALEGAGDGVWDWHVQAGILHLSKRWKEMLGHTEDEIGINLDEWINRIHADDLPRAMEGIKAYLNGQISTKANEYRMQCKDGRYKWILTRGMVVSRDQNNIPERIIGTNTDITERKSDEETIQHQANFDALTQLPNRRLFYDRLEQEIRKVERSGMPIALMLIDLDHFKDVNDTLGHDIGDILLMEVAQRIKSCVRDADTVARLGGDEFTVILSEQNDTGSTERIAQKILHRLSQPFQLQGNVTYISASIGITLYPEDSTKIEALLKNAEQAMYAAKHYGRNRFSYFTPSMQISAQNRMLLSRDLRVALPDNQFRVYYQPIVTLANNTICKAEALIRWQHPERGLVNPADFISIAEETGLIVDIGDWVFREAARHAARWRISHHKKFQISVNVSPVQFHNAGINYKAWFDYLQNLGLPGQSIVVEITEGMLLDAHADTTNQLLAFRDAGIGVSIDDFGTGYSSLSYLKKFDIDYLKIDQSFVKNLTAGSDDMILCEAIIAMAHKLGLKVIAEGVETIEQRDLLTTAGCDYGQGYLFSKPVPTDEFEDLLKNWVVYPAGEFLPA